MLDRISTYADDDSLLRMVKYVYPKKSSGAGTLFTDSL